MTAIKATLHSYKSLATRPELQITLQVPQEFAADALRMLGVVDPGGSQWFALTRLNPPAEQSSSDVSRPTESLGGPDSLPQAGPRHNQGSVDRERTPFAQKPFSVQAALKLEDEDFRKWLGLGRTCTSESAWKQMCDQFLKAKLDIASKRELDTNPEKAKLWSEMLASYEYRNMAR